MCECLSVQRAEPGCYVESVTIENVTELSTVSHLLKVCVMCRKQDCHSVMEQLSVSLSLSLFLYLCSWWHDVGVRLSWSYLCVVEPRANNPLLINSQHCSVQFDINCWALSKQLVVKDSDTPFPLGCNSNMWGICPQDKTSVLFHCLCCTISLLYL